MRKVRPVSRASFSLLLAVAALVALVLLPSADAAAKTYVSCIRYVDGNAEDVLLAKPRSCNFTVPSGTPGGISIRHIKWNRWGGDKAKGRGQYVGNMNQRFKVHIELLSRMPCTGYGFIYTQMNLTGFPNPVALSQCV